MKPYYEHDGIRLFCGEAGQVLTSLGERFDLLLTDPPYGIGESPAKIARRNRYRRGLTNTASKALAAQRDYGHFDWDSSPADPWLILLARSLCTHQIIFGGNYYDLPPTKCWLVWDKQNGESDFADCELAWTNLDKAVRRKIHLWNGMIRKNGEGRWHPTQKPLDVMLWAIHQAPESVQTILDPFAGPGTTLVAAKRLGKQATGIEREERYCEIAAQRLAQGVLDFGTAA